MTAMTVTRNDIEDVDRSVSVRLSDTPCYVKCLILLLQLQINEVRLWRRVAQWHEQIVNVCDVVCNVVLYAILALTSGDSKLSCRREIARPMSFGKVITRNWSCQTAIVDMHLVNVLLDFLSWLWPPLGIQGHRGYEFLSVDRFVSDTYVVIFKN